MNWEEYTIAQIQTGKSPEGVKLLLLFLKDVKEKLNIFQPNAHCGACLNDYYKRLTKNKNINIMANTEQPKSKYRLLEKRNNIQVEFGGNDFLNNQNITDERAEKLIERFKKLKGKDFKMTDLFALYPEEKPAKASTKEASKEATGAAKKETVKDKKEATKEATGAIEAAATVNNGEPAKEEIKPMPGVDDQINKLEDKLNLDD